MNQAPRTLSHYIVVAISPALIIALVASLVLFLLEVFYTGEHLWRLRVIFFLFTLGMVLVNRIAMEEGWSYATFYALPLAVLTYIAMQMLFRADGALAGLSWLINLMLIALVWWSAFRLTKDCTLVETAPDASGQGLMQMLGWDGAKAATTPDSAVDREPQTAPLQDAADHPALADSDVDEAGAKTEGTLSVFRKWWKKLHEQDKRPHAHGKWIVYYALAALPLFGLGQWFIEASNLGLRRYTFFLLCIFVAAALGLLVTTSFLSIRRYLQQRNVEMPAETAASWIGVGIMLTLGLMFAVWLLPRPAPEISITQIPVKFKSRDDLRPSDYGVGSEGVKSDETSGSATGEDSGDANDRSGNNSGQSSGNGGQSKGNGSSGKSGKSPNGQSQSGDENGQSQSGTSDGDKNSEKGGGEKSENGEGGGDQGAGSDGEKSGDENQQSGGGEKSQGGSSGGGGGSKSNSGSKSSSGGQSKSNDSGQQDASESNPSDQSGQSSEPDDSSGQSQGAQSSSSSNPLTTVLQGIQWLTNLLKWIVIVALICLLAFFAWRNREQLCEAWARFLERLRELWARLFGGHKKVSEETPPQVEATKPPARPFSAFADPFESGLAARMTHAELVKYSFEACEAWARENECARGPEETPFEFARRVGEKVPSLSSSVHHLSELYSRVAYDAPGRTHPTSADVLKQLWSQLRAAALAVV